MRWLTLFISRGPPIVLFVMFTTACAHAQTPPARPSFDPHGKSAGEIASHFGLGETTGCLRFVDRVAVDFRKERWREAIDAMWVADPDAVLGWIIGRDDPPEVAADEARRQRDCVISRMLKDAADPDTRLLLEVHHHVDKHDLERMSHRFRTSRSYRRQVLAGLTWSGYRSAASQSHIWKRKFVFYGKRHFNRISPHAAQKCHLTAGNTWKPGHHRHRRCWLHELTYPEREQEILGASSAPGISRHHWGTDFDLFGLNPQEFTSGHRRADEYAWMEAHAVDFGFFQPYATAVRTDGYGYMEERWHWSYYPIAQALLEFASTHQGRVEAALDAQWDGFEARWNRGRSTPRPFFGFVRKHWRDFMFNVDDTLMRRRDVALSKKDLDR